MAYHIEFTRGDSLKQSEGTHKAYTKESSETHWPTTLAEVHFYAEPTTTAINNGRATALQLLEDVACTVTQASGSNQAFYLELTTAQTDDLSALANPHDYEFAFVANKSTHPLTLRSGTLTVRQTLRTLA